MVKEQFSLNPINKTESKGEGNGKHRKVERNSNPAVVETNGSSLIQINALSYVHQIEDAVSRFEKATKDEDRKKIKEEFLNIINELKALADDDLIDLSNEQRVAIKNDIAIAFQPFDKVEALNQFKKAIKFALDNDIKELIPAIENNMDHVHDEIDNETWKVVSQSWFTENKEGKLFLDIKELKINEIKNLEISEGEFMLLKQLCLKDDYSFEHSVRVTSIALRIMDHLQRTDKFKIGNENIELSDLDKEVFARASLLHDVGKASKDENGVDLIPDDILKAYYQRALPQEEKGIIFQHVENGVRDLKNLNKNDDPLFQRVIHIVERHHKRVGQYSGYPEPIVNYDPEHNLDDALAEILALADTIEAMTADERDYQETKTLDDARNLFTKESVLLDGSVEEALKNRYSSRMNSFIFSENFWQEIKEEFIEVDEVTGKVNGKVNGNLKL